MRKNVALLLMFMVGLHLGEFIMRILITTLLKLD
jgi:hypothetical protein